MSSLCHSYNDGFVPMSGTKIDVRQKIHSTQTIFHSAIVFEHLTVKIKQKRFQAITLLIKKLNTFLRIVVRKIPYLVSKIAKIKLFAIFIYCIRPFYNFVNDE